jgi:hypothetical protein
MRRSRSRRTFTGVWVESIVWTRFAP